MEFAKDSQQQNRGRTFSKIRQTASAEFSLCARDVDVY